MPGPQGELELAPVASQSSSLATVLAVAKDALPGYLHEGTAHLFTNPEDMKVAEVSDFVIPTLDVDSSRLQDDSDLESLLVDAQSWQVLVTAHGKPVAWMRVERMDGELQVVAFGFAARAEQVFSVLQQWPAAAGYQHVSVESKNPRGEFIAVSQENQRIGLVPLSPGLMFLGMNPRAFDPAMIVDSVPFVNRLQELRAAPNAGTILQ